MKHIKDFEVSNKNVLVRCDLNVPFDDKGNITDDFRIVKSLPTIKFLSDNNAKVILTSHLSNDEAKSDKEVELSLAPVAIALSNLLGKSVAFANDCIGDQTKEIISGMNPGEIILLENLRNHPEEEAGDDNFAKELAGLADIYVNDAFGVCHRAHASVVGVPKYLPSAAGFLLFEEIDNLSKILDNPARPLVAIIGGAKLKTKIKVINQFIDKADHILIGGKIADVILQGKGLATSGAMPEQEILDLVAKIDITNPKIHLPVDAVACLEKDGGSYMRKTPIGTIHKDEKMYDIGPDTIRLFSDIIAQAKTVFLNGPMGFIEKPDYIFGTLEISKAIIESKAFSIVGGGETVGFLKNNNLMNSFGYVSTGGGAMLSFVGKDKMPGLEALGYNN